MTTVKQRLWKFNLNKNKECVKITQLNFIELNVSILLLERLVELEYSLTLNIKFTSYMAMTKDRNNNNTNELL